MLNEVILAGSPNWRLRGTKVCGEYQVEFGTNGATCGMLGIIEAEQMSERGTSRMESQGSRHSLKRGMEL